MASTSSALVADRNGIIEGSPGARIRVLSSLDIERLPVDTSEVLDLIAHAYCALGQGASDNPGKVKVNGPDGRSVAYAMLGRDGHRDIVGFKTSYKHDPDHDRANQTYCTTLLLFDDATGAPLGLLDCRRIGALRTPAVSALLVRACARTDARRVLLVGSGTQGRTSLPFLFTAVPTIEEVTVFGTNPVGLEAVVDSVKSTRPGQAVHVLDDVSQLEAAARSTDIVVAAAGSATPAAIESSWLAPGATVILVGHGLAPSTLRDADRVIATSGAQMAITGRDMADADGHLRTPDAELPAVLAGHATGRGDDDEVVFAYNSGLVVTDIALGHHFLALAAERGLGVEVPLW